MGSKEHSGWVMGGEGSIEARLTAFEEAYQWLLGLIQDPTGERVKLVKSQEMYQVEHGLRLERTREFLAFCGQPQEKFPAIHIAGTSGKGSVTTILAAILTAWGARTGHHISPYLQLCTEKLIVNGRWLRPSAFAELVNVHFRPKYEAWIGAGHDLRYGEAWVALTYIWLALEEVEWGVMETGLGGRYDPTNVLPAKIGIITNVDWDHIKTLGPTLADIARHKAGIIKPGQWVVSTAEKPLVREIVAAEAAVQGAELLQMGRDFAVEEVVMTAEGSRFNLVTPWGVWEDIRLPLAGAFQVTNAAAALMGAAVAREVFGQAGSVAMARAAVAEVRFSGRMELMQTEPLVILDGAHNGPKMAALVASVAAWRGERPVWVILGALASKSATGILAPLVGIGSWFGVTEPNVYAKMPHSAAALAAELGEMVAGVPVTIYDGVEAAIRDAVAQAPAEAIILVTGSLYLVGEARGCWYPQQQLLLDIEATGWP
ncbi:MAG TPA: Mur ligase family protein [Anaerolineae bacterium]|nr:Mur ligase family protein [Anaerolineae bacterium]